MIVIYRIYQLFIALPLLLAATVVAALLTIVVTGPVAYGHVYSAGSAGLKLKCVAKNISSKNGPMFLLQIIRARSIYSLSTAIWATTSGG